MVKRYGGTRTQNWKNEIYFLRSSMVELAWWFQSVWAQLEFIYGIMNHKAYIKLLKKNLASSVEKMGLPVEHAKEYNWLKEWRKNGHQLTKKQQMTLVESFRKRILECHGNNGRLNTENQSTFEKTVSSTHCNNNLFISYCWLVISKFWRVRNFRITL